MIALTKPPRSNMSSSPMPRPSVKTTHPSAAPGKAQQDGHEEPAGIVARHERLADETGYEPEYQCTNHLCLLC